MHCFGWEKEMTNKKGIAIFMFAIPFQTPCITKDRVTILQMRMT